jgi:dolichyl-phosphate-mannose-protein mannosyltransferase
LLFSFIDIFSAFDFEWWFWLSMTGLSIGCVTSVKWIGLFVMALVGAHTADELWEKFGDLRMPLVSPIHLFLFLPLR